MFGLELPYSQDISIPISDKLVLEIVEERKRRKGKEHTMGQRVLEEQALQAHTGNIEIGDAGKLQVDISSLSGPNSNCIEVLIESDQKNGAKAGLGVQASPKI